MEKTKLEFIVHHGKESPALAKIGLRLGLGEGKVADIYKVLESGLRKVFQWEGACLILANDYTSLGLVGKRQLF